MLSNMAISLIMHKRITTTLPKAKELKKFVEPLLTKAKKLTAGSAIEAVNAGRVIFSHLQNKEALKELKLVSEKIAARPGGYTRIIKTGFRQGDQAQMCFIELVDYNEDMAKTAKKATRTRRGRGKGAAAAEAPAATAEATAPAAEVAATDTAE
jgi:large subunit ribosomal protein L17